MFSGRGLLAGRFAAFAAITTASGGALVLFIVRKRRRRCNAACQHVPTRLALHNDDTRSVEINLRASAPPCVFAGIPLGICREQWTTGYLESTIGDLKVSVHVSSTPCLDFTTKNFAYEIMSMRELLRRILADSGANKQYYYYRSQHSKRNKPSSLEVLGPIADDFALPASLLGNCSVHSTVLRIASCGLRMWLHYDICDNFLCCVRGRKRVVLIHPREAGNLYLSGSSSALGSRPLGIHEGTREAASLWHEFPLAKLAWEGRMEVILEEGDVLFIPALWLHCTEAVHSAASGDFCISTNVFFVRPELEGMHDPKDVWANRELLPAQEAFKAIDDKAVPALQRTPAAHRAFCCRKIAASMLQMAAAADSEVQNNGTC